MNCTCTIGRLLLLVLATAPLIGCGRTDHSQTEASASSVAQPAILPVVRCAAILESDGPALVPGGQSIQEEANIGSKIDGKVAAASSPPLVFELSQEDISRQAAMVESRMTDAAAASQAPAATADPPNMMLPWGPTKPSPEMTAVAQRAEQAARRGFSLAQRGAMYSARAQFIEALRILAEAFDEQRSTSAHTKALAAGLRAMEEVNDLAPRDNRLATELNLKLIVDAHRTTVLKDRPLEGIMPADAQRIYLTYAQEQLAAAAGDQAVASLALHGLGRICVAPAEMHGPREQVAEAKAVTYYQAALLVAPENYLAANELGVLLTRYGRLKEARSVFEQAAKTSDAPTTWRNLAAVCERLGEATKASDARLEADAAMARLEKSGRASAAMRYPIQWVPPEKFADSSTVATTASGPTTSVMTASPSSAQGAAKQSDQTTATAAKPSGIVWPWTRK